MGVTRSSEGAKKEEMLFFLSSKGDACSRVQELRGHFRLFVASRDTN
jgi:hypothetical protein